jgi:hypothetical protein
MVVRQYGTSEELDLNNSNLTASSATPATEDETEHLGASLQSDNIHDRVWGIDNTVSSFNSTL